MQQRVLGRTGRRLSVIGFGGIVVTDVSPAEAAAFVDRAIERGINYFDSVLLPINLFCWRDGGFGSRVCAKALEKGTGILALKALARRPWREGETKKWPKCWYAPIDSAPEARVALAFTLSQPVTAAVSPGHAELLWLTYDAAEALAARRLEAPQEASLEGEPIFSSLK